MAHYRALFENKQLVSVTRSEQTEPIGDMPAEESTGATLWASLEAASDEEAREKAERLQTELQTGKTKRELEGNTDTGRLAE